MRGIATRLRLLVLSTVLVGSALQADTASTRWYLDSCPPENSAKAESVRTELRLAAPGSSAYVPIPYPTTEGQVIEDLEYQFLDLWSKDLPTEVPSDVQPALKALKSKSARFEVLEFADWRSARCGFVYGQTDFRYLIRVFPARDEEELARIVINNTGLLGTFVTPRAATFGRETGFESIESMEDLRARSEVAAGASDFQYVAVSGFGLNCSDVRPCIAFRVSGRAHLSQGGKIYALDLTRPGVTGVRPEEVSLGTPKSAGAESALGPGEHLVALGTNVLAVAVPVPE